MRREWKAVRKDVTSLGAGDGVSPNIVCRALGVEGVFALVKV